MANKGLYCAINFLSFNDFGRKFSSAIDSTIRAGGLGGNSAARAGGKGGSVERGPPCSGYRGAHGTPTQAGARPLSCTAPQTVWPARCELPLLPRGMCGRWGHLGMLGRLPAVREGARHPHRAGCSSHAPHTRAEHVTGILTPCSALPRDSGFMLPAPRLSMSQGSRPTFSPSHGHL